MVQIGSGSIISGAVVHEGKFAAGSGELKLTEVKESWYPDPARRGQKEAFKDESIQDKVYSYEFDENGSKLGIYDPEFSGSELYYRAVEGR